MSIRRFTTLTALMALVASTTATAGTVSFTRNVNGYTGQTDIYVPRAFGQSATATTAVATDATTAEVLFIDQDGTNTTSFGAAIY